MPGYSVHTDQSDYVGRYNAFEDSIGKASLEFMWAPMLESGNEIILVVKTRKSSTTKLEDTDYFDKD